MKQMESKVYSSKEVIEDLKTIIVEKLDVNIDISEITEEVSLIEGGIGLDSIAIVNLIVCIEDTYDMQFSEDEITMDMFQNLKNLSNCVVQKLS